jgi:hypothetical protein
MEVDTNEIVNILTHILCEDIANEIVEKYLLCSECKCLYDKNITNYGCKSCQDDLWGYWADKYLGWC